MLSIGFGDDDSFNCGDYGDGYPAHYELLGVTKEDVICFFSQYDSSNFDWGLTSILHAKLLEMHDGYFLVEPVEGSREINSADKIEIPMKNMSPSPELEVGDILVIEYDGQLQEAYPARINNPYSIGVMEDVKTWDLIPMVMVNGILYLDTGHESHAAERTDHFDGEIISQVDGSEKPSVDDQSNFGTGYCYQYGATEGTIELFMNGKWWIFATEEARQTIQFPSVQNEPAKFYLTIGAEGVKSIELTMPNSSGGCENADGSLFKKGERIWLENLDGYNDLRGVMITAKDSNGYDVFSVRVSDFFDSDNLDEPIVCGEWIITAETEPRLLLHLRANSRGFFFKKL